MNCTTGIGQGGEEVIVRGWGERETDRLGDRLNVFELTLVAARGTWGWIQFFLVLTIEWRKNIYNGRDREKEETRASECVVKAAASFKFE